MRQLLNWKRACVAMLLLTAAGCGGKSEPAAGGDTAAPDDDMFLAYVTNGIDPFWVVAQAGVEAAAKDFNVKAEVHMPPKGLVDQKRMMETLLSRGVAGMAISPIDAANQVAFINEAAKVTKVITQDSDAPGSDRLCFVGMDNYKAGRAAGQLVKEALPDGGGVMIFVGRLEQLNSRQRRQGVIDELLDRPMQVTGSIEFEEPAGTPSNDTYQILGTRTDNFDYAKAKANAEDALASVDGLDCMVGLFAYNIPNCLTAVKEADKLGEVKLVSFDEADDTLQGIKDGYVQGTISQQPFEYGYQSIRILKGLAEGDESVLPEDGVLEIDIVEVRKDNVEAFWDKLNELRGV